MKGIKFKAWLESLQVMVSVRKIEFLDDGNYKIFFKNLQNGKYVDCALAPSSMISRSSTKGERFALMQYTGMKDRTGREIYEGDIIRGEFISDKTQAAGEIRYFGKDASYICRLIGGDYALLVKLEGLEVIGNIYENPEILKDI